MLFCMVTIARCELHPFYSAWIHVCEHTYTRSSHYCIREQPPVAGVPILWLLSFPCDFVTFQKILPWPVTACVIFSTTPSPTPLAKLCDPWPSLMKWTWPRDLNEKCFVTLCSFCYTGRRWLYVYAVVTTPWYILDAGAIIIAHK